MKIHFIATIWKDLKLSFYMVCDVIGNQYTDVSMQTFGALLVQ